MSSLAPFARGLILRRLSASSGGYGDHIAHKLLCSLAWLRPIGYFFEAQVLRQLIMRPLTGSIAILTIWIEELLHPVILEYRRIV
jgi:hypothetical protein